MSKKSSKYISVFIPLYNGEKYLAESIDSILSQKLPVGYKLEVLLTDSGSTDDTVNIARLYQATYPDTITFDQIPNADFGHGRTRQRAAEKAVGDYILFLTQDATPADTEWLIHMIEPFFVSNQVGCVFGRQVPRPYAIPTIKREVVSVFNQFGVADQIVLHRKGSLWDDSSVGQGNTFFSDVNSAVRKDLVLQIPFRDVAYAEDQALANDVMDKGYIKAYAPQGAVWHSNEYTPNEFRKRKFDEYVGLHESIGYKLNLSRRSLLLGWIRPTLADWRFIGGDRNYGTLLKLKYFVLTIAYNYASKLGEYEAAAHFDNPGKRSKLSLENSRKQHK